MTRRLAVAVLALFISTSVASAAEATLGKTTLQLVTPQGFCALEESNPVDGRIVAALRQAMLPGHLLGQFTDCRQIDDWRTGKRTTLDYAFHYVARPNMVQAEVRANAADVKEFCTYLRNEGAKQFAGLEPELKTRIETSFKGMKVGEPRFIGVVAEERESCYWAMLQGLQTEAGAQKINAVISAIALVKDKLVTSVLTSPFVNTESVETSLARQKRNIAALLAANKN